VKHYLACDVQLRHADMVSIRRVTPPHVVGLDLPRSRNTFGTFYGSRSAEPHQLFEDVGGLPVGELAPEVVILSHADLGVPELVADLARGHLRVIEEARDGLAQRVADQPIYPGVVANFAAIPAERWMGHASHQGNRGTPLALRPQWRGGGV
jgi:hypothetical protein